MFLKSCFELVTQFCLQHSQQLSVSNSSRINSRFKMFYFSHRKKNFVGHIMYSSSRHDNGFGAYNCSPYEGLIIANLGRGKGGGNIRESDIRAYSSVCR